MSYRIFVSPPSPDGREALTLQPGENWLKLTRDPDDGVVRPTLVAAATTAGTAAEAPPPATLPSSSGPTAAAAAAAAADSTCFLSLQYHRGLLLARDMRYGPHDNNSNRRPWHAWYDDDDDGDNDVDNGPGQQRDASSPSPRAVPLHPRQAIWLPHRGRLMLSRGSSSSSSPADLGLLPPPAIDSGDSQETITTAAAPHLVWLEFWCGDGSDRETADRALQASAVRAAGIKKKKGDAGERVADAVAAAAAAADAKRSADVPTATLATGTKSPESSLAEANGVRGSNEEEAAVANEGSHDSASGAPPPDGARTPPRPGAVIPPPSSHARPNPPLGAFVYTAESQTPPPPGRKENGGGGGGCRGGGSPGLAAVVDLREKEAEPEKEEKNAPKAPSSHGNHDSRDQSQELAPPQSKSQPQASGLEPEAARTEEDGGADAAHEGEEEEDVVMDDVEADASSQIPDPSVAQASVDEASAPRPPPPPQALALCSPVDDLLTQPPERDDPKGPAATTAAEAAAGSQAQESQKVAAAASARALAPIEETVGKKEDDDVDIDDVDDDATVDPDEAQESSRDVSDGEKVAVAPPPETNCDATEGEKTTVALLQESSTDADDDTHAAFPDAATPTRQSDAKRSPRRLPPGELPSPAASDTESQSLLTPPSAATKSRPPNVEASTPSAVTSDPSAATDPDKSPMEVITNGSPPAPSAEEQACASTSNPPEKVGNGGDEARQSLPNSATDNLTGSTADPVTDHVLAADDGSASSPSDPNTSDRGTASESGTVSSKASPSTPKTKKDDPAADQNSTPKEPETGSPISPSHVVSTKGATTSMAEEEEKPRGARTSASPAATRADEDATVRRSARKRPSSADEGSRSSPSKGPPSTRKKARGGEGRRLAVDLEALEEENVQPRRTGETASCYVLTTSFDDSMSQKIANMVKQLGGVVIEDLKGAHKCTHLVASDGKTSIKRTPKLMIALCVTTNIVTLKWLKDSVAAGALRDTKQYLILRDKEAEKAYSFTMSKTLQRVKERQAKGATLLQGRKVFVCPTVFNNTEDGKKSPPATDLRLIVGAAGGEWVEKSKDLNAARAEECLVITNAETKLKKTQEKQTDVARALANGADSVSLKSFLHAMMTQDAGSLV